MTALRTTRLHLPTIAHSKPTVYISTDRCIGYVVYTTEYDESTVYRKIVAYSRAEPTYQWQYRQTLEDRKMPATALPSGCAIQADGHLLVASVCQGDKGGYVFSYQTDDGLTWMASQYYRETTPGYGCSVALSRTGAQLVVGTYHLDQPNPIHCYQTGRPISTLLYSETPYLDLFGSALAIDPVSDLLIVGAPRTEPLLHHEQLPLQGCGQVYFYHYREMQWCRSRHPHHHKVGKTQYGHRITIEGDRLLVADAQTVYKLPAEEWRIPPPLSF